MSRPTLPERRHGPLPEIPLAETDEILSSWVSRTAAVYHARPEVLLEQVGVTELSAAVLDRHATGADLKELSIALHSSPEAIGRMCFASQPREALELVTHRAPLWTCWQCAGDFTGRGLQVKLRQWFIAVASWCRRCGGPLTPRRSRTGRAVRELVASGDLYAVHTATCHKLARAFLDGRPVSAATRAMRALAASLPVDKRVRYLARNRGRLPFSPGGTPPLLWQLSETRRLRRHTHEYRHWRPPADRPYAAWPAVGQMAATAGLNALARTGMETWGILVDLGLVDHGDELVVKEMLAGPD